MYAKVAEVIFFQEKMGQGPARAKLVKIVNILPHPMATNVSHLHCLTVFRKTNMAGATNRMAAPWVKHTPAESVVLRLHCKETPRNSQESVSNVMWTARNAQDLRSLNV